MDISDLSQRANDTIATPPRRQNNVATSPQRQKTPSPHHVSVGIGYIHSICIQYKVFIIMTTHLYMEPSVYFRRTAILDKQSPRQSYAAVTSSNHLAPTLTLTITHPSLDKMAAISQTTFSNAFSYKTKNIYIFLTKISLKLVPKGPIDINPALVQTMAWRRIGDKPSSEPMLT